MAPDAFELDRFAPPTGVTVKFRNGKSFRFSGDPDVDDVAVMLRLEAGITAKSGDELAATITEGKETLKRLILEADSTQDVTALKVGSEEMLVVFALLVHGSTVAEAVGAAITDYNVRAGESREDETDEQRQERIAQEGDDPGPLSPSASSSSERSSGSAEDALSRPATG